MRFFLGLCAIFAIPLWANTEVTTRIHDIDHGENITDEALVFLASGQVAKINVNNTDLLKKLNKSLQMRESVNLELDENREIVNIATSTDKSVFTETEPEPAPVIDPKILSTDPMAGYNASVITPETAKKIFSEARHASKEETQCFNRAHIWSYEWRVKHNIYSTKIWIFFTRKYIRKFNFEWWFHVSPMINMIVDGQIKERVMDRKYSTGALSIQKWANLFLRDDFKCPLVKSYSEHASFPETGSCFFQKSSMYFYQPLDLEFLEKYGTMKTSWLEFEVRQAYGEAFEIFP